MAGSTAVLDVLQNDTFEMLDDLFCSHEHRHLDGAINKAELLQFTSLTLSFISGLCVKSQLFSVPCHRPA